jgi:hypothetical protein
VFPIRESRSGSCSQVAAASALLIISLFTVVLDFQGTLPGENSIYLTLT